MEALKDYEGYYLINKEGEVYGIKRKKIVKPRINKNSGYYQINICKNGIRKTHLLHRLLALQYISNPEGKPVIDHMDRNRQNNSLDNLKWATHSENNFNVELKGGIQEYTRPNKSMYYYVRITINKVRYSKSFKTREEAEEHLKEKVEEYNSML